MSLVMTVAVVNIPPPPTPLSLKKALSQKGKKWRKWKRHTNRAAINIGRLPERPQNRVPTPAKKTAVWFAPRRPKTLERRP